MQFKFQVVIDNEAGDAVTEDILTLDKFAGEGELLGLSLARSERLLERLQQHIVQEHAKRYMQAHRRCPHCSKKRRIKGYCDIQYRTLFGIVPIPNTRLHRCQCEEPESKTFGVLNN
ncbi:MAG: hypothetical protein AAGI44_00215 [Pseudomonadota bacterium]